MQKAIDRLLKYGTILCTIAFLSSVLVQIFARFFLESAPAWTEEASRLFFIYAIAFSAGIAIKGGYYVSLEYFFNLFPLRFRKLLKQGILILNCLLFGMITIYSLGFVRLGIAEFSPSMGISMSISFFSMVIMFASLFYYSVVQLIKTMCKEWA